ncbi:MAG: DNA mismatch repair protein MutS [Clostridiales bacterium]|nr:DNA mismatch repair protein MutS [Clostridiales bacterium]
MAGYTPMMEQYLDIKSKYKDCLLFFRLGDFYELFFDDAKTTSKELGLTLTGKSCGLPERAPMCGVPFHSADSYISKLISKGYKVAICEQTENPKFAKNLVKRDVIRVITPGTVLDDKSLDEGKNNYIMCLYFDNEGVGAAVCDVTTGVFLTTEVKGSEDNKIIDEIAKYSPSQIVVNAENNVTEAVYGIFDLKCEKYYDWAFGKDNAELKICNHLGLHNLSGLELSDKPLSVCSSGALLEYLYETHKNNLSNIRNIKYYSDSSFMILDISSRKNLELTSTLRDKSKKGSLLWVLDKTKTAAGARLLRRWLEQPLIDEKEIIKRQDGVEAFRNNVIDREELREYLNTIHDIERIMGKVVYMSANAKDLNSLKSSFKNLPHIKSLLEGFSSDYVNSLGEELDLLSDVYDLLDRAIDEEAPFSLREGGLIKKGYDAEVDKLNEAKENGSKWVTRLETDEKEKTGIKNLRIKYNKVFGYFIEVTNSYKDMVPERYIRKQTLTGSERYITSELKEIEEVILGAEEKVTDLEYDIFCSVRNKVSSEINRIQKTAEILSLTDVLCSLGEVADKNNYCRPVVNNGNVIDIQGGRHPVVELMGKETFIPNDTLTDCDENRLLIITGPNMAGKSTYMRQTALLVLMAQIGSFIPAAKATIGICDRIFTRVGASDDLATGQSTFMIEMAEVANILNNATKKSLLILDEIGRGTSTYDGLSIAWAVLEYIADKKSLGARTLFATHYHELTDLEGKIDGVKNYCVAVEERGEDVIFLRKIIRGGTDKSYGIHVARLAGVPGSVLKRAGGILENLIEKSGISIDFPSDCPQYDNEPGEPLRLKLEEDRKTAVIKEISKLDLNNITPLEAISILYDLKTKTEGL